MTTASLALRDGMSHLEVPAPLPPLAQESLGWPQGCTRARKQEELGWEKPWLVRQGPGLPPGPVPRALGNTMPLFGIWPAQGALPQNTNPSKGLSSPSPSPSNANVPGLFS